MHPKPNFSFDIGEKKLYDKNVNTAGYRNIGRKMHLKRQLGGAFFYIHIHFTIHTFGWQEAMDANRN